MSFNITPVASGLSRNTSLQCDEYWQCWNQYFPDNDERMVSPPPAWLHSTRTRAIRNFIALAWGGDLVYNDLSLKKSLMESTGGALAAHRRRSKMSSDSDFQSELLRQANDFFDLTLYKRITFMKQFNAIIIIVPKIFNVCFTAIGTFAENCKKSW